MQRLDRPIANGCFGVSLVWISRNRSATAASPPVDSRISPRSAASRRSNSDPGNARAAACSSDSATDSQPASAGPGRGTACSTRCGIARSLPSAAARSSSSSGRRVPVRQVLEQVLDRVSLRQPVDQLHLLDRDRRLVCDRRGDLALLGVDATVAGIAQRQDADQLLGGHHRHHHGRIRVVAPQRNGQPAAGFGAAAAGRQRQLHAELVHVQRPRGGLLLRPGRAGGQRVAVGIGHQHVAARRPEQPLGAPGNGRQQALQGGRRRKRPGQV